MSTGKPVFLTKNSSYLIRLVVDAGAGSADSIRLSDGSEIDGVSSIRFQPQAAPAPIAAPKTNVGGATNGSPAFPERRASAARHC